MIPLLWMHSASGQPPSVDGKKDTVRVLQTKINDEIMPWVVLSDVPIRSKRVFKTLEHKRNFQRLRYNVLKVMPYAIAARNKYHAYEYKVANAKTVAEKRKLKEDYEKEIKETFYKEIKNLTITQGGILIKLIDREVGSCAYDLARSFKGPIHAFFYQSLARLFGNNLKQTYNAEEDHEIEHILLDAGYYRK